MQIFMILIGLLIAFVSISFIRSEIIKILYGIKDPYERIRNELRAAPAKYGNELNKTEKFLGITLTLIIGVMFICAGIAWITIPIMSVINNIK